MTVASLWKVLDKSGCGRAVGVSEFTGTNNVNNNNNNRDAAAAAAAAAKASLKGVNPWNYNATAATSRISVNNNNNNNNNNKTKKIKTLAVDLSIWICESLTSHAISEHHSNPSLHLVFSRTIKLLTLGIGLVFVVEGKRRIRASPDDLGGVGDDKFHKRRSGTAFWKACRDCQEMLQLLGVPVVKAKAEGEALCALLNQRGIVDGVISNDGDCLLFGAKTVYTKFSIENLESCNIVRYDLDNLLATTVCAADGGDDDNDKDSDGDENNANTALDAAEPPATTSLTLSRTDLIAFALLTGSDLAGSGLPKVGYKKAIRFIRKCQQDNPLQSSNAAIEELQSWARTTAACKPATAPQDREGQEKPKATKCCTRCCHPGSKRSHEKYGCETCGTQPGEPCFEVTTEDRFRKSLRAKALAVQPKFDPAQVMQAYLRPNDNQIPAKLSVITPENPLEMGTPDFTSLMQMLLIVKGRSLEGSREYLKQAVGRLLSRSELTRLVPSVAAACGGQQPQKRLSRERPVPQKICKELTQKQVPCYEVSWKVNATITDDDGNGIDGYEYSTIEPRDLVQDRYPALVKLFAQQEKERQKQGDGEKMRRQNFLQSLLIDAPIVASKAAGGAAADDTEKQKEAERPPTPVKRSKKREGFFAEQQQQEQKQKKSKRPCTGADKADEAPKEPQCKRAGAGQDVGHLLRFITNPVANAFRGALRAKDHFDHDTIESQSDDELLKVTKHRHKNMKRYTRNRRNRRAVKKASGHEHLPVPGGEDLVFCYMGDFKIEITPIRSVRPGKYPPPHVFVHHRLGVKP
jgi:XPG I-region/Chromatin organization modifier domain 2